MYTRTNISFKAMNVVLKGWFYKPRITPAPCVIMTHGFSALKEHQLDKFASHFSNAGLCVLAYDNRNFGESTGEPRLEVDPIAQVHDMKYAISFVQTKKEVDSKRIGLWGTSFSGGTVLVTAATDKRISCVVSQVPFISGHHKYIRSKRPEQWEKMKKKYEADRQARLAGKPPTMFSVVSNDPEKPAIMSIPSAFSFFTSVPTWENKVTLRSIENSGEFEPLAYLKDIENIPLLFIVAKNDTINATDLALKAYEKAHDPKKLVLIEGNHFAPYTEQFDICSTEATNWYKTHLAKSLTETNEHSITAKL